MASPFVELEVGSRTVKVTNPDKVLFPDAGHTKRDLVDYYLAVGDGIVRALRERPTQLRRFPVFPRPSTSRCRAGQPVGN